MKFILFLWRTNAKALILCVKYVGYNPTYQYHSHCCNNWLNNNTSYIMKWQDYAYDLTNSMEQSPSSEDNSSLAAYRLSLQHMHNRSSSSPFVVATKLIQIVFSRRSSCYFAFYNKSALTKFAFFKRSVRYGLYIISGPISKWHCHSRHSSSRIRHVACINHRKLRSTAFKCVLQWWNSWNLVNGSVSKTQQSQKHTESHIMVISKDYLLLL